MTILSKTLTLTVLTSLLALSNPAIGAELKTNIKVNTSTIRLGDLFSDTGHFASAVIEAAPEPGTRKTISIARLVGIATYYGLEWTPPSNVNYTTITRSGDVINQSNLSDLVKTSLEAEGIDSRISVNITQQSAQAILPDGYKLADISSSGTDLNRQTGNFTIAYNVPTGTGGTTRVNVRGRMQEVVSIPVLRNAKVAGDVISESDVTWTDIPVNRIGQNILQSQSDLVGQATRRPLQANTPLRQTDVQRPVVIKKGEFVNVRIDNGNLSISMMGRALDNGGNGDVIRIVNTMSHQTIEGIVEGAGRATVMTGFQQAYASR